MRCRSSRAWKRLFLCSSVAGENKFPSNDEKRARDERSVFVGNVDYSVTPENLMEVFASVGTVNQITIPTDRNGHPKGFAYVEFNERDAVEAALKLTGHDLNGREIKVTHKV